MYLSDRDIKWAIEHQQLIIEPKPDYEKSLSSTSLDLRLDNADKAKIWNIEKYIARNKSSGHPDRELVLGKFRYPEFSPEFLTALPEDEVGNRVFRRGKEVIVKNGGFLLWQTKEKVGTPRDSNLICFVDGKSTLARTGLLVHLTAPTIHTTWSGHITLEITNVGPFDFVLKEDDYVVQITVSTVTSIPNKDQLASKTYDQSNVSGRKDT